MRPYVANLSSCAEFTLTVASLSKQAERTIDTVAKQFNVSRAHVARCVINDAVQRPNLIANLVTKTGATKRNRYAPTPKRSAKKKPEPVKPKTRQDEVCESINGSVRFGGCTYPHCSCK